MTIPGESLLEGTPFAGSEGDRATFVQFSSAFCAPCRATRRVLEEVTALVPGISHVEIDAELHLDLVRRVDVLRTPTTIVLDAAGREVTRAAGAPTKAQVLQALSIVPSRE
jgi:thiol-disulfide isomerase/thioredoxin